MEIVALVSSLPAVIQAAVADDAGRLLACAGDRDAPPDAAILVLAHATLSAASELGRRAGSGECQEIVQQHEKGVIYLHALPHHRVLVVRCENATPIPAVRDACSRLLRPITPPLQTAPIPALDLSDALHAEPRW